MALKHVILRQTAKSGSLESASPTTANRGGRGGRGEIDRRFAFAEPMERRAAEPPPIRVDVDDISSQRAARLAKEPDVLAVALAIPMKLIEPVAVLSADDPFADGSTWGIKAVRADMSPFTGDGVVVALLDTGIDATHPAFSGIDLVRQNFTDDVDDDTHGHGTHCAGTIFGRDVDGKRIGVARGMKKALIGKVLGSKGAGSDAIAQAIQWSFVNGANVISMSLGIDFPGLVEKLLAEGYPADLATSMALEGYRKNVLLFESLARLAVARSPFVLPCLLVAAAGNESRREQDPRFQIAVSPPAVADGVISVAAICPVPDGLSIATFSNTGARVSGPGVGVMSAKLGGGLTSKSGTSMATPHVTGVAALWAEKLMKLGQFKAPLFEDRVIGSTTQDGFVANLDANDVGGGIVMAPGK